MTDKQFIEKFSLDGEVWKPIKGFENRYLVSNLGRVIGLSREVSIGKNKRTIYTRFLNLTPHKNTQYVRVILYNDSGDKTMLVHRLVAEAFIPNPENKSIVDHIDADRTNNKVSNLRWVTTKENMNNENYLNYLKTRKRSTPKYKDTAKYFIALLDNVPVRFFKSGKEAHSFGYEYVSIWKCFKDKSRTYKGFHWMYLQDYLESIDNSKQY